MHILTFGDSLTAGYGLSAKDSFAAKLEKRLLDRGYQVRVTNAGISGDTSGGGRSRLAWSLQDKPDLVILELGANDGLRGLDPAKMQENLDAIIADCQRIGARIILAGMRAPVNWGPAYRHNFEAVFPTLADRHKLPLYPFFLEGVITDTSLVQEDGLHPTAPGVEKIVTNIMPLVEKELSAIGN